MPEMMAIASVYVYTCVCARIHISVQYWVHHQHHHVKTFQMRHKILPCPIACLCVWLALLVFWFRQNVAMLWHRMFGGCCLWQGHRMHAIGKGSFVLMLLLFQFFVLQSKRLPCNSHTCVYTHTFVYTYRPEHSMCLVNLCQTEICIKLNKSLVLT